MATKRCLKDTFKVTKHNALNEMRANNMTMQELRLFSVYLSRVNPNDRTTRHVKFSLSEFQAIMELGRMNVSYYKKVAESLLSKVITLTTKYGGFDAFTLFSRFRLDSDEQGGWYVDIIANDEAMPFLFEFKNNYFKYELWNALHLKGPNQLRMYEILKQYERIGYRIVTLADLRHWLGIEENEYPLYSTFRRDVLEPCKKAISDNTDISFTYEPHKRGAKGKIFELKFNIQRNANHKDPLTLRKFVELNSDNIIDINTQLDLNDIDSDSMSEPLDAGFIPKRNAIIDVWNMDDDNINPDTLPKYEARLVFLRGAVNGEFTRDQMVVLYDLMAERMPQIFNDDTECYDHLRRKYNAVKLIDNQGKIRHSCFGYLKSIIGMD